MISEFIFNCSASTFFCFESQGLQLYFEDWTTSLLSLAGHFFYIRRSLSLACANISLFFSQEERDKVSQSTSLTFKFCSIPQLKSSTSVSLKSFFFSFPQPMWVQSPQPMYCIDTRLTTKQRNKWKEMWAAPFPLRLLFRFWKGNRLSPTSKDYFLLANRISPLSENHGCHVSKGFLFVFQRRRRERFFWSFNQSMQRMRRWRSKRSEHNTSNLRHRTLFLNRFPLLGVWRAQSSYGNNNENGRFSCIVSEVLCGLPRPRQEKELRAHSREAGLAWLRKLRQELWHRGRKRVDSLRQR